jgi:hypothetical protein
MTLEFLKIAAMSIFVIVVALIPLTSNAKDQFSITEKDFIPEYKEECNTNIKLSMEDGKYIADGMHSAKGGNYCHKARHTLIGKVIIFAYVFDSEKDDPLQFIVDKDKGYVYVKGKGTITNPDGKAIKLPLKK